MNNFTLYNGNSTLGIFDFDGNTLETKTQVYFKNKQSGEVEKFTGHYVDQNLGLFYGPKSIYAETTYTYAQARDVISYEKHKGFDGMLGDIQEAIESNNFAPSFEAFKDMYLIKARPFAILTARGNAPDNFQRAFMNINNFVLDNEEKEEQIENIIGNYGNLIKKITGFNKLSNGELLDFYFGEIANYIPCTNSHVAKYLGLGGLRGSERKAKAIDFLLPNYIGLLENMYSKKIREIITPEKSLSVGFSDDSMSNIISVYNKFQDILHSKDFFPDVSKKFSVYFTGATNNYEKLLSSLSGTYENREETYGLKIKLKT